MELKRKFAAAAATGALLLNALAPTAYAGTTIQLSGNGSNSNNTANVDTSSSQTVVQNNTANVTNNIDVNAGTGGNTANDNTGGDVKVKTGDANVTANVTNTLNQNSAELNCGCANGDTSVLISGNGTHSDNDVSLNTTNNTNVFQDNNAKVNNKINVDAKTGNNDAEDNTGGDVSIDTGNADVNVTTNTTANVNSARVGGSGTTGNGGALSLRILGNGSHSDNNIDLGLDNSTNVVQNNDANVTNNVDVDAQTGDNNAEDNTGGDVSVNTGDTDINVAADTMVNFNAADVNCGCLLDDLLAKIDGNGTDSNNDINASLAFNDGNRDGTFQGNDANVNNKLNDIKGKTGNNDAEDNTGSVENSNDPSIDTGDSSVDVSAATGGNVNVVGPDSSWDLPQVDVNVDLQGLMDLLGMLGLLH